MTPIGSTSSNIRRAIEFMVDPTFCNPGAPSGRSRSVGRPRTAKLIAQRSRSPLARGFDRARDASVERTELPQQVRLSKRAVKTMVDGVARHGWASVDGGVVRLTSVARRARDEWGAAIGEAESEWPGAPSLRAPLAALVSGLP